MVQGNPIEIVEYDPEWPQSFHDLRTVIAKSLGDLALAIEHVGSTAVPGLPAKPIIDIDVVIESDAQLSQVVKRLAGLGYVHQGDLGIAQRQAFKRVGDDVPRDGTGRSWPQHHLYVCPKDSRELRRHLAFRDRLRADPHAARAYGELKKQLAQQNTEDRESYWRGKTDFIEAILLSTMTGPVILPMDFALLTARCRLRCVSKADIPHVFAATRFSGFNDGMVWDAPDNMESLNEPLQRNLAAWAAGTAFCFTIESKADATFFGRISIRKEREPGIWSIGFWTHPRHQGQGYMSEAAPAVVDFGFAQLAAERIDAGHAVWNTKSESVLKKAGMTFTYYLAEGFKKNGRWVEENVLTILRSDWDARKGIVKQNV